MPTPDSAGAIRLGPNQYGKDQIRVVRVLRGHDADEVLDYNVSVSLAGDFDAAHTAGDNRTVLPTDTMKNTVFAFASDDVAVAQPETYGLLLARHFCDTIPSVSRARVTLQQYPWTRLSHDGRPHPHGFRRTGGHVRTATVTATTSSTSVVSGLTDLTVLKTTDSGFVDFHRDRLTTLEPATDRILATTITAQWLHVAVQRDWAGSFETVLTAMLDTFAGHRSLALQQTMYLLGESVLTAEDGLAEIRFSCPNSHHFAVDLGRLGLADDGDVFHADDRPYGLIEGAIVRDGADDAGLAFDLGLGW